MTDLPTVVTAAGLQPQSPASLNAQIIANAEALDPGLTTNLPGSLIEDVASTDTGAVIVIDQARVDFFNSLTPLGANLFLLNQLGQIYGVLQGGPSNTSVFVVFSGPPGFVIDVGFTVSDGTYQYTVQDGGIIASAGQSSPLFCLATQPGIWAIPQGTVTQVVTSVPSGISLTVTNPNAGTPGSGSQSVADYRAAVLQAGLAASQGMPRYLKTLLGNVSGVQARLVSVIQATGGGWEIIVGGGDPYEVAYAIYSAIFDISTLKGSTLSISGITNANPGVATTTLNHGLTTGETINVLGSSPTGFNSTGATATVITEKTFSYGVNTTSAGSYVGGGVVTPNSRNEVVSINDYPNTYQVPFVLPPQQAVAVTLTWNTDSPNSVSDAAVAQAGSPAIVNYINSITVGDYLNVFNLEAAFATAIASIIAPVYLTRMVTAVSINGIPTSPSAGTNIIAGDPESYFFTSSTQITIQRG